MDIYRKLVDNFCDGVCFVDRDRKITYWNRGARQVTGFKKAEVMGTPYFRDILKPATMRGKSQSSSTCPLAATIKDGKSRKSEVIMHHKEGYRIPVLLKTRPIHDNKREVIGAVANFSDISEKLATLERVEELERMAYIDALTGLANRRFTEMNLQSRCDEMKRFGLSFGVLYMDIDHFKKINDVYGHDRGDEVLKVIAKTFTSSSRTFDLIGRWGGEEFLGILPSVDKNNLHHVANRYRVLIEKSETPVTISIGATLARGEDSCETLVKRVDDLMYQSKVSGRNRVSVDTFQ